MVGRNGCVRTDDVFAEHRDKGACTNATRIRRDRLEEQLLAWLTRDLLTSDRIGEAAIALHAQIRERLSKAGENYWATQVEIQQLEVEAWAALAEGKKEEALRPFALFQEADRTAKELWGPNSENLQIIWQVCPACSAILATNQCT